MTPYLLLTTSVAILFIASTTVVLVATWLGRQTQREEQLRLTRWLAIFELDSELLFETDNEARIRRHARTDRPLSDRAAILRRAHEGGSRPAATHDLACLDNRALQGELNALFEA